MTPAMPPMPAATTPVTAAATTPAVNAAITAAKDLPGLVQALQTASPQLAQQIEGKPLLASKSPLGTVIGLILGWAIPHYGLACTAAVTTDCWTQNTIDLASGAGAIVGTALAAYVMRYVTTSPISGWFSKATIPPAAPATGAGA